MAMAAVSTLHHNGFLTSGNLLLQLHTNRATSLPRNSSSIVLLSCHRSSTDRKQIDKDEDTANNSAGDDHEFRLAKLAVVTLAAGVLALGAPHDAAAAKSGGRVGGQAFRSAAPKSYGPRINNSRTNIYINPPVAPPLVGGYGYGVPYYGGWGWSPFTFFAPGPSVAVGIGGGFELFALILAFGAAASLIRRFRGPSDDDEEDY